MTYCAGFGDFSPEAAKFEANAQHGLLAVLYLLIFISLFFTAMFTSATSSLLQHIHFRSKNHWLLGSHARGAAAGWFMLLLYVVIGAGMFNAIEYEKSTTDTENWWAAYCDVINSFFKDMDGLQLKDYTDMNCTDPAVAFNISTMCNDANGDISSPLKQDVCTFLASLDSLGTCSPPAKSNPWQMGGACLYAFTVISTIGYGHFNVSTDKGKLFVIVYGLGGFQGFAFEELNENSQVSCITLID